MPTSTHATLIPPCVCVLANAPLKIQCTYTWKMASHLNLSNPSAPLHSFPPCLWLSAAVNASKRLFRKRVVHTRLQIRAVHVDDAIPRSATRSNVHTYPLRTPFQSLLLSLSLSFSHYIETASTLSNLSHRAACSVRQVAQC